MSIIILINSHGCVIIFNIINHLSGLWVHYNMLPIYNPIYRYDYIIYPFKYIRYIQLKNEINGDGRQKISTSVLLSYFQRYCL